MAKKKLYEMTNGEKYKHFKKNRNLALAGKWTSVIAPFGVVFGLKFNEYVSIVDQGEQIKLTVGCVLAIIVAAIAIYREAKKSANKNVAPVFGWGLALLFVFLFQAIINDLMLIIGAEFAGQCSAAGLNYYSDYCYKEADEYRKLARQDNTLTSAPQKQKQAQQPNYSATVERF